MFANVSNRLLLAVADLQMAANGYGNVFTCVHLLVAGGHGVFELIEN